jgi:hypothetical protein
MSLVSTQNLSLEKQFELARLCSSVDSIENIDVLKKYTKEVIRCSVVNEKVYQDSTNQIILTYENQCASLLSIIDTLTRANRMLLGASRR